MRGVVSPDPAKARVLTAPLRVGALWDDQKPDPDVRRILEDLLRRSLPLDAVVLVVRKLGARQYSVLRELRSSLPAEALVVVSDVLTRTALREAERAGADALVLRNRASSALPAAIRAARTGQLVVPRDLARQNARPVLTVREKQVLGMVVLGYTNGEIAAKLYVTKSTVKSHLSAAFAKLGVSSRNEATQLILDPDRGLGTGILAISQGETTDAPSRT